MHPHPPTSSAAISSPAGENTPGITLRPEQRAAVDAVLAAFGDGAKSVLIKMPTGAGKTITFAKIISAYGQRALVLAHREELLAQAVQKMGMATPDLSVGLVRAATNLHEGVDVVVGSVQTLANPARREQVEGIKLVVVDEAHHAAADTYKDILDYYAAQGARILGVTATPARADGRALDEVFPDGQVYEVDTLDLIAAGHLCDVRGIRVTSADLDLTKVRKTGGDYAEGALAKAMTEADMWSFAAQAYLEHAADRQGIAFAPTVAAAVELAEELTARGISSGWVSGDQPMEQRQDVLRRFRTGELRVVSNCAVLTEGYDAPFASAVLLARPTQSAGLYIQMAGRALRTWPGKADALVIDVVGASAEHSLASITDLTGHDVTPRDGETLREAAERAEVEAGRRAAAAGELRSREVDLFHRSPVIWSQHAGLFYVVAGDHLVTIEPAEDGTFTAVAYLAPRGTLRARRVIREGLDLGYAHGIAEGHARNLAHMLVSRSAPWRTERSPSPGQLRLARRLRVPAAQIAQATTSGAISDLIDAAQFKPLVERIAAGQVAA